MTNSLGLGSGSSMLRMLEQPEKTPYQLWVAYLQSIYMREKLTSLLVPLLVGWIFSSYLISAQIDPT